MAACLSRNVKAHCSASQTGQSAANSPEAGTFGYPGPLQRRRSVQKDAKSG